MCVCVSQCKVNLKLRSPSFSSSELQIISTYKRQQSLWLCCTHVNLFVCNRLSPGRLPTHDSYKIYDLLSPAEITALCVHTPLYYFNSCIFDNNALWSSHHTVYPPPLLLSTSHHCDRQSMRSKS